MSKDSSASTWVADQHEILRRRESDLLAGVGSRRVYYVNSYRATPSERNADWVLATSDYGGEFVGVVNRGAVYATQFHPEKSGAAGLRGCCRTSWSRARGAPTVLAMQVRRFARCEVMTIYFAAC